MVSYNVSKLDREFSQNLYSYSSCVFVNFADYFGEGVSERCYDQPGAAKVSSNGSNTRWMPGSKMDTLLILPFFWPPVWWWCLKRGGCWIQVLAYITNQSAEQ